MDYTSYGYRYTKYCKSNGTIYLRYTLSKKCGCHGLAKISGEINLLEVTNSHNHSRAEHHSDSIVLANRIKRSAESCTDYLREIFNNECRSSPVGCTLTFKQLESIMCKRRRVDLPKLPPTAGECAELLLDSPFSSNHRFTIKEGNGTALVFATDLLISKLIAVETIHFDATFKVVPHLFISYSQSLSNIKDMLFPRYIY